MRPIVAACGKAYARTGVKVLVEAGYGRVEFWER
jgi:hypothetical protein